MRHLIRKLVDTALRDVLRRLDDSQRELGELRAAVTADTTSSEEHLGPLTESVASLSAQLQRYRIELDALTAAGHHDHWVKRLARMSDGGSLAHLDEPTAQLLNYASSHRGYAAQAELWMNPPLVMEHRAGEVRLRHVNERIVEVPFAMRALGGVELGGRVLDVGAAESSVALSLATMGFDVTALDLRPYPFAHPNLRTVAQPLEEFDEPDESFDAVLLVSTVEHIGLGWYGEQPDRYDDKRAMARLRELLKPEGALVLTVPYGAPSVDAVQRRYDKAGLDALLEGFEEQERIVLEQSDERTWASVAESTGHAVALVRARRNG